MSPVSRTLILVRELLLASLAAACLVLCVAIMITWPRSHWTADSYWWNDPGRVRALVTSAGSFELYFREVPATAGFRILGSRGHRGGQPVSDPLDGVRKSDLPTRWTFLGFGHATDGAGLRIIVLPAWSIALITAAVPPLWLLRHRRRRADDRRRRNLCVRCGYDLRASPERCPECGTPIRFDGLKGTPEWAWVYPSRGAAGSAAPGAAPDLLVSRRNPGLRLRSDPA